MDAHGDGAPALRLGLIHGREIGKINGRLCLPAPFKDAARTRAQWKNVSRPPEIFRKSE